MTINRSGITVTTSSTIDQETPAVPAILIKKYANRRLYNTDSSTYVTLEHLALMVKAGTDFIVQDAKTGDDITRSVLTQIIVEEESKGGQNLLPISFLRQLIGFYGNSMQWIVPKYLDHSMHMLSRNQEQMREYFSNTLGGIFPFGSTFEEMGKQNLAMMERAMRLFTPASLGGDAAEPPAAEPLAAAAVKARPPAETEATLAEMQRRLDELQKQMMALGNKTTSRKE